MSRIESMEDVLSFVRSAEAGSFATAAARLHLTRSAVGKAVARLEGQLGVRLFHRTTRKLSLTIEGRAFFEHCRRAIHELEVGAEAARSGLDTPRGLLRATVPVLFGRTCVAPVLSAWLAKHRDAKLEVAFTDGRVDLVEEGFDLGVRIGALEDSSTLVARAIGQQRMVLCAAPHYLRRRRRPRTIDELVDHDAVVYRSAGVTRPWLVLDEHGVERSAPISPRLALDDVQAIVDATVAGAGIARLPCWLLARTVARGELEIVLDGSRVVPSPVHVVRPAAQWVPSRTRSAIDELLAKLPSQLAAGDRAALARVGAKGCS
jgi:DNA-binding transcriptional LysR family regulator